MIVLLCVGFGLLLGAEAVVLAHLVSAVLELWAADPSRRRQEIFDAFHASGR
jgi:hypothetical protein